MYVVLVLLTSVTAGAFVANLFYDHFTFDTRLQRTIDYCNELQSETGLVDESGWHAAIGRLVRLTFMTLLISNFYKNMPIMLTLRH